MGPGLTDGANIAWHRAGRCHVRPDSLRYFACMARESTGEILLE